MNLNLSAKILTTTAFAVMSVSSHALPVTIIVPHIAAQTAIRAATMSHTYTSQPRRSPDSDQQASVEEGEIQSMAIQQGFSSLRKKSLGDADAVTYGGEMDPLDYEAKRCIDFISLKTSYIKVAKEEKLLFEGVDNKEYQKGIRSIRDGAERVLNEVADCRNNPKVMERVSAFYRQNNLGIPDSESDSILHAP